MVLLAAGELAPEQAELLRSHARTCPACARYLREMSSLSETLQTAAVEPAVEASDLFHSSVVRKLRAQNAIGRSWFEQLTSIEKWGVAAAALAVGLAVLSGVFAKLSHSPPRHIAENTVTSYVEPEPAPTLSNYQIVANRSLEEFDGLLTRQANRGLPPVRLYTPASVPGNEWD